MHLDFEMHVYAIFWIFKKLIARDIAQLRVLG